MPREIMQVTKYVHGSTMFRRQVEIALLVIAPEHCFGMEKLVGNHPVHDCLDFRWKWEGIESNGKEEGNFSSSEEIK